MRTAAPVWRASAGILRSRLRISTPAILALRASPSWSLPRLSWTWGAAGTARQSSRSNSRPLPQGSQTIDSRSSQPDLRPHRHDAGRIDAAVALVIVMLDVEEV